MMDRCRPADLPQSADDGDDQGRLGFIARAFHLLEVLAAQERPAKLRRMTQVSNLPQTTVHRLLAAMTRQGLVVRTSAGYSLGERAMALSADARQTQRDRHHVLMPHLVDLHVEVALPVRLGVLDGNECVYAVTVRGSRIRPVIGNERVPAHACAAGKALLASQGEQVEAGSWPETLERVTPFTVVDPQLLTTQIVQARMSGVAVATQEDHLGVVEVARVIPVASTSTALAIEVVGIAGAFNPHRITHAHKRAVLAAAAALRGWQQRKAQPMPVPPEERPCGLD